MDARWHKPQTGNYFEKVARMQRAGMAPSQYAAAVDDGGEPSLSC